MILRFEPVHVGMDFNVGFMAAVGAELHNGVLYVMKEFIDYVDTPAMILAVKAYFLERKIFVYPDATGVKRTSTNAKESDISLLRSAGYTIRARSINPLVKDRIAAVNLALARKKLFINTETCPELTEALEQQIYNVHGDPDKSSGLDHRLDALGYLVNYIMPVKDRRLLAMGVGH